MNKIMKSVSEHNAKVSKEFPQYEIVGTFLYGSQNYGLDTEDSDVDTVTLVMPTARSLYSDQERPKEIILSNGEHCVTRDIRLFFRGLLKNSFNDVELLFSRYNIVSSKYTILWNKLLEHREEIGRVNEKNFVYSVLGMAYNNHKKIYQEKNTKNDQYNQKGYNAKARMRFLYEYLVITKYMEGYKVADVFYQSEEARKQLIKIKEGVKNKDFSKERLEYFKKVSDIDLNWLETITAFYIKKGYKPSEQTQKLIDDFAYLFLKTYFNY